MRRQILAGVAYLHTNNVLHCDLKPENILISAEGSAKICDFGFAENYPQSTTSEDRFRGTFIYMAPELLRKSSQKNTYATDMWSVGCILYILLTKHGIPFGRKKLGPLKHFRTASERRFLIFDIFKFLKPPAGADLISSVFPEDAGLLAAIRGLPRGEGPDWKEKLVASGSDPEAVDLLAKLWEICPHKRITAPQALAHQYFRN